LIGLGLLAGLAAAEGLLRLSSSPVVGLEHQPLIYRGDAELGFRYAPAAVDRMHRNFEIDNEVRINSAGFHDIERPWSRADRRIVALGDSMTAGLQVPATDTWPRLLESELRAIGPSPRIQVFNLGVDGTGPQHQLAMLREQVGTLAPDVVVVGVYENDALDVTQPTPLREVYRDHVLIATERTELPALRERIDRHLERTLLRRLHRASYLGRAVVYAFDGRHSLLRSNVVRSSALGGGREPARSTESVSAVRRAFEELVRLGEQLGFEILVVPVPPRDDAEGTARSLSELRTIDGLSWLDPLPGIADQLRREQRKHRDLYWRHDGHLNASGHRALAKAIAQGAKERLVPGFDAPTRRLVALSQPERLLSPPDGFRPETPFTVAREAPRLAFAIYPVPPSEEVSPHWGHWGTGTVHPNGKVYGIVGNHLGREGQAFLYELDPSGGELHRLAELQDAVGAGGQRDFGFGKVHGRVDHGRDGRLYFTSWGGLWRHDPEHPGSRMFAFDPVTREIFDHDVLVPRWGTPSTRLHLPSMRYYAEFLSADERDADFLVYDIESRRVVFRGGHDGVARGRDFFVDDAGRAYYNNGQGSLEVYDPADGSLRPFPARMPGEMIRRVTGPDARGRMYGVTLEEHLLFSLDPRSRTIETVAELWSQTATICVDASGRYLYYVAGSNRSDADGTQLVQVDLDAGGAQKVIAFLDRVLLEEFGYRVGRSGESGISPVDSYNLTISPDGRQLYVALNGTMAGSGLERAAVIVVDVPAAERGGARAADSPTLRAHEPPIGQAAASPPSG
jgi:lysophospholipase L1-like esterase